MTRQPFVHPYSSLLFSSFRLCHEFDFSEASSDFSFARHLHSSPIPASVEVDSPFDEMKETPGVPRIDQVSYRFLLSSPVSLSRLFSTLLSPHMSNSQSVTILASLGDTLNLIDAVKDKWTTHTLPASERWALNNWCNGARAAIYNYILLLDNSEPGKQNKLMRLNLNSGNGTDTFDSVGEININQSRCLPRRPYGRITSCLQGILNDCETGQYDNPSALVSVSVKTKSR